MKKVILGITGSIAIYKSLYLVRLLTAAGCEVRVVMTPSASKFITPLTFATLSRNKVDVDLIDDESWSNHVELGMWADVMIIAPVTATTLSKLAIGQSDNMLVATYLSAKCPVFIAPAMDLDMWKHPATMANINALLSFGNYIIPVGYGELASGLIGDGRMAEPQDILNTVHAFFASKDDMKGMKVMVTAGPTREAIDPVRFIGNYSSGLQGICLAEECAFRGAQVDLILGPTHLKTHVSGVRTISVTSAQEMYEASRASFASSDVTFLAAAVADYKAKHVSKEKMKKKEGPLTLELDRTHDIAYELGKCKQHHQTTVGFALETSNEESNARKKLERKNFDLIVINSLQDDGAGFKYPTNKISILHKDNKISRFELKSKKEVAKDIVDETLPIIRMKQPS